MENIHPGHALLRKLVPDTKLRREIVSELCGRKRDIATRLQYANELWCSNQVSAGSSQWSIIFDFIDSI